LSYVGPRLKYHISPGGSNPRRSSLNSLSNLIKEELFVSHEQGDDGPSKEDNQEDNKLFD